MTLRELRERVASHAPGSMIPRDWILNELSEATGEPSDVNSWVDIFRAAEITGRPEKWLRGKAPAWRGRRKPTIRVSKNDPQNDGSRWLFAEGDCWAYAREQGRCGPEGAPHGADRDDDEALLQHWALRATENL